MSKDGHAPTVLTDWQWSQLLPLLPKDSPGPKSKSGDRLFLDVVLYHVAPLPPAHPGDLEDRRVRKRYLSL